VLAVLSTADFEGDFDIRTNDILELTTDEKLILRSGVSIFVVKHLKIV
jgi:hypothetical protein